MTIDVMYKLAIKKWKWIVKEKILYYDETTIETCIPELKRYADASHCAFCFKYFNNRCNCPVCPLTKANQCCIKTNSLWDIWSDERFEHGVRIDAAKKLLALIQKLYRIYKKRLSNVR
jgi:hypothetical protein